MATETTLRYIKFDYQSHKDALLQRVRERWPRVWNDFLSNSFGIVLVDIVAWSTASIAFLVNRIAAENYVSTMTLRESAQRLGSLTGYQLRNPIPSTVSCEATLTTAASATVTIAQGTLIRTSDKNGLPFEVVEDYTIEAGSLTPRTLVLTISADASGANVLNTFVKLTNGTVNADLLDTTVDLSQYVEIGQTFNKEGDTTLYTITGLEAVPGSVASNTRMILDRNYEGSTETTSVQVYDQRIALVQGQTVTDRFVAPAVETPNFPVRLSRTPVVDGSVTVTVNGEPWTEVGLTEFRDASSQVFVVKTYVDGTTSVLFGDGDFGAVVPTDAAITVTYRIGGGTKGNIALNTINTSVSGLIESLSSPVPVTVTNSTSTGMGGRDAETLEEARVNIPYYTRTNDRAVTLDDYQTIAQQYSSAQFGSVAYARSAVRTENNFLEGNIVVIYAWTTGSSGGLVNLSAQLKQALRDYVQTKAVGTDLVEIFDGSSRPVPVSLRFKVFSGFSVTDTRRLVTDTINSTVNALRPGQTLVYSNLVRSLDEVYGVDTVNMATPIADLVPSNSTELFTQPQDDYVYALERTGSSSTVTDANGDSVSQYTAQLPMYPVAAWSIRLFLGTEELTILPYLRPGYARILGTNLSQDDTTDSGDDGLPDYNSTVNLLTGQLTLWIKGAPGDLTLKLNTVVGYSSERPINVYIGYTGDNTLTKRREIRSILRSWSDNLAVGQTIYASRVTSVSASYTSIEDVVASVTGVDAVNRVALETPANNEDRVVANDYELLRLGNIVLNNQVD